MLGEEALERVGRERAGEQEALGEVAALALQRPDLAVLLDALGERLQAERLAELDQVCVSACASLESARPVMNVRSIFSESTGNWRR